MSATTAVRSRSARDLAEATPSTRDRYVDALRALSIAVVVLGHWLMAIVFYEHGRVAGGSALEVIPGIWVLTWILQVMPLFFFVGGFSNLVSLRAAYAKGESPSAFIHSRVRRLMRPTLVFISAWVVLAFVVEHFFGLGPAVAHATGAIAKPVWFLAVYVFVVALAPFMLALHERYAVRVPIALVAGAVAVDVLRIGGGMELIGYLNFAFVWLFAHQLGFFYADGTLTSLSRSFFAKSAAFAVGSLVVLTNISVYSRSMVGVTGDGVSNNDPPSICLIVLTIWLVSLAMLARERATGWLQSTSRWTVVVAANSMIMTVFLWHLTALLLGVLVAYPLGFPQHAGGTVGWWLTRPLWVGILMVALVPIVMVFARYERPAAGRTEPGPPPDPVATGVGVALLIVGMAGFAQGGFAGVVAPTGTDLGLFVANPLLSAIHLLVAITLLRPHHRRFIPLVSACLVALAALESVPLEPRLASVIPVVPGNVVLHLMCGLVLGLFVREPRRERGSR